MRSYIKLIFLFFISLFILSACVGNQTGSSGGVTPANNQINAKFMDTNDSFKLVVYDVSDTVFAGETYNPKFIIKNNSSKTIPVSSFNVTVSDPAIWNPVAANCPSIPAGGSCTITGTFSLANPNTNATISVALNGTDGTPVYTHTQNIAAIEPAPQGLVAVRINYPTGGTQKVYAVAQIGGRMIKFDDAHHGIATADTIDGPLSYKTYAIEVAGSPSDNSVLYLPGVAGGKIFLSFDNPLSDGPAPSLTGGDENNKETIWQAVEIYSGGTGGLSNINATNVDAVSVPVELSVVVSGVVDGETSGYAATTTANYDMQSIPMTQVLSDIAESMSAWPNSWGKLVYRNKSGQILRILAASQTVNSWDMGDNFSTADFTPYVNDLWDYYKLDGHNLYVDVSAISAGVPGHEGSKCIVEGHIESSDNKFHFIPLNVDQGECPEYSGPNRLPTGHIESETFTKFTAGDFILGASGGSYTTWGPNGSYRSWLGQTIVSAQSVGLFPFCNDPLAIYGKDMFMKYDSLFYTPQYSSCLGNYAFYTDKVINQYMTQSAKYFNYYNYAYGDTLGKDGSLYDLNIARYPMTITLGKMK